MSVVKFPKRHPGTQGPGGAVLTVPMLVNSPINLVLVGIAPQALAEAEAKVAELVRAFDQTHRITNELQDILKPFLAEGTE